MELREYQIGFKSARSAAIRGGLATLSAIYRRRLRRYPDLEDFLTESCRNPSRSARASEADCIALYEAVKARRPKEILELGPGYSTAAISLAMPNDARFVAVEENADWLACHRKNFPDVRAEMIQRDAIICEVDGARYRDLPQRAYDFIHVDGPATAGISRDVIDLLPILARQCFIIFDGREASARWAWPFLKERGFRSSRHRFTLSYQFARD